MKKLLVTKINNKWCVRNAEGKKLSKSYHHKSEAYTEMHKMNNSTSEVDRLAAYAAIESAFAKEHPTYQKLVMGRWSKFQKGKWTAKKSPGPYKNIPIFED